MDDTVRRELEALWSEVQDVKAQQQAMPFANAKRVVHGPWVVIAKTEDGESEMQPVPDNDNPPAGALRETWFYGADDQVLGNAWEVRDEPAAAAKAAAEDPAEDDDEDVADDDEEDEEDYDDDEEDADDDDEPDEDLPEDDEEEDWDDPATIARYV